MADGKRNKKPLKHIETTLKEVFNVGLDKFLEKNIEKLKEDDKKEFSEAQAEGDIEKKAKMLGKYLFWQNLTENVLKVDDLDVKDVKPHSSGASKYQELPDKPINTLKICPPEHFRRQKENEEKIYPVNKEGCKRFALIICNIEFKKYTERNGAEVDIKGMEDLLTDLGYIVDVRRNLTSLEMESELRKFALLEHASSDSTFVVLMSHGILDAICGKNHEKEKPDVLPYDTIFSILNTKNCPNLKDKPKVIIIQACRGAQSGKVLMSDSPEISKESENNPELFEEDALFETHIEKDFISFFSSTPNTVSWRDREQGSLFIVKLIDHMRKHSRCCHIVEIFQKVQRAFDSAHVKHQMPTIERMTLTKNFYLFPSN
ncbi:caspase-13-like [Gracilinanus agilis]|uniref:caspase-13-like n=1 Tax=Gracilinanus agilis TaxID=191870 RepID=UPI001CFD0AFA|nr:caspase-13-like [Gracilinanus agilis]